jgi:dihydropyrimidinase
VIVDMEHEHTLRASEDYSIAGYSLYDGITFKGWPMTTVLRGSVIAEANQVTASPGYGRCIARALSDDPDRRRAWEGLYPTEYSGPQRQLAADLSRLGQA